MIKTIKKENLSRTNWRVLHPNGKFMFFADEKKVNWYLSRNLATALDGHDVQLTFEPSGNGYDESDTFGVSPREVRCVCCGEPDALLMQKHHIVPYMYRKHMPEGYKSKNHHDVVLICYHCHEKYEVFASALKKELLEKYGIVDDSTVQQKNICWNMAGERGDYRNVGSYVAAMLSAKALPVDVRARMLPVVEEFIGKQSPSIADLEAARGFMERNRRSLSQPVVAIGERVLAFVDDLDGFVYMWRQHFLETMLPQYMPVGWSATRQPVSRQDE